VDTCQNLPHDEDGMHCSSRRKRYLYFATISCESNYIVPVHEEVALYIQLMKHLAVGSRDAMQFWWTHYFALPLLLSIVKRILPAHPCSTDVERLFSVN
jgi:hypothetical protein